MSFKAHKELRFYAQKSNGTPGADQLALINQFTLKEMAPDEVYTRTVILAHNAIDRDNEVFDESLLQSFAKTLPGKGLFNKHPNGWDGDSGPGIGLWYSAKVLDMSLDEARTLVGEDLQFPPGTDRAKLLQADYYMARTDDNKSFLLNIDAGIIRYLSLGFSAAQRTDITDASNNILARRLHAPGEALEGSFVWLGAQPGARNIKHLKTEQETEERPMAMSTEEQKALDDAKASAKAAKGQIDELMPKATAYDALKSAIGNEASDSEIIELAKHALEMRGKMIDAIIRAKRLKGHIGDNDEQRMNDLKGFYAKAPFSLLESEHQAALKDLPGSESQLDGGDPNATGAQKNKGLRDRTVTQKALGQTAAA